MHRIVWKRLRRAPGRRLSAGVVLLAYLGALFGFPMPAAARTKTADQPFACQSRACGCVSADNCRHQCCCSGLQAPAVPDESPAPSCCSKKHAKKVAAKQSLWHLGMSPMRCQGITTLWVSTGIVVPPPLPQNWQPQLVVVDSLSNVEPLLNGISPTPPEPPPRLSA